MRNHNNIISYEKLARCIAKKPNGEQCKFPVWYKTAKYCFLHIIARHEEDENNEQKNNTNVVDCNVVTPDNLG